MRIDLFRMEGTQCLPMQVQEPPDASPDPDRLREARLKYPASRRRRAATLP